MTTDTKTFSRRAKRWTLIIVIAALLASVSGWWALKQGRPWLYGLEAYMYGFPLVMMDLTKDAATAVPTAGEITAPVNQFAVMTKYPDASFRAVVRTGLDTLFATAWADLDKEPLVLSVPDTGGRYYVIALFDNVEQCVRVDRQAHDRNRSGELPDCRARLAGHAACRRQADIPLADPVRVGQRSDVGKRAAGIRRGRCAAEAIQAHAAQRLGQAL